MLREFWEQFPDICLTFSQKKKKKKQKMFKRFRDMSLDTPNLV